MAGHLKVKPQDSTQTLITEQSGLVPSAGKVDLSLSDPDTLSLIEVSGMNSKLQIEKAVIEFGCD
jgi:hypothetical protein